MKNKNIHVSIGMPIYKGGSYIDETVKTVLRQSWENFDVLMSIDNNDQESAEICKKYLLDPRFKMHVHTKRLGWVKNISWLMAHQKGDYWYYQQQDDLVKPNYIETLLEYAQKHPEASVVYCDISCFGSLTHNFVQESITGTPYEREIELLRHRFPAVALRGLIPKSVIQQAKGLRDNACNSFCSDTTWMARVARYGELHRVPKLLYKKRYHDMSTHTVWSKQPASQLEYAWATHCVDMFIEALPVAKNTHERYMLFKSALYRLLKSTVSRTYIQPTTWSKGKRMKYVLVFLWILIPALLLSSPQPRW